MDPSLFFQKHCNYVTDKIDKRNNMLKAPAGSSWGQEKETLLRTYNALWKSIASYAAPVWSTNASDSSFKKIQTAQNAALRTATGVTRWAVLTIFIRSPSHWKSKTTQICSLRSTLWPVWKTTTSVMASQLKKETLHSRHHSTVLPRIGASRKDHLQNLNKHAVDSAMQILYNRVLKERPPPISDEGQSLNRRQRWTLSHLPSGHCHLLHDYKHRVFGEPSDIRTDCVASPQDVRHLFACTAHPTDLSPEDLWQNPVGSISEFSYLIDGNLDWLEDGADHGKQRGVYQSRRKYDNNPYHF